MFERYDRFTKDEFADFLIKAYRRFGMLLMILDRAPQHKAALVHETLAGLNGMIELEYLPPGCPELNAVEEIWRQMKHAVLDVTYLTDCTKYAQSPCGCIASVMRRYDV